ncbi:DHHC palmitoyltransferase-domain-containing protein [Dissophora ornata]|nr:DHHC palmitoyltransferase-domain-containing protein [Dissophora ornata]
MGTSSRQGQLQTTQDTAGLSTGVTRAAGTTAGAISVASAITGSVAVGVTMDGYRVHPSALPTSLSTVSSAQNMTAVAAAQHAAALAASDSIHATNGSATQSNDSGPTSVKPCSPVSFVFGAIRGVLHRLMPLLLVLVIGYIYYVYTFRVCLSYILWTLHRPVQAGVYIGISNTLSLLFLISYIRCIYRGPGSPLEPTKKNPPPPTPPTTTPYQAQRVSPPLSTSMSNETAGNRSDVPTTDTTPLLRPAQTNSYSSTPNYNATLQRADHSTTSNLESKDDPVRINIGQGAGLMQQQGLVEPPVATLSITKRDGRRRWCDICKMGKPDRCHHCSECNKCVLRMDHHCPWIGGCIGYKNHKFFYLFIYYSSVVAVWVLVTMIPLIVTAVRRCESSSPLDQMDDEDWQLAQPRCTIDGHWIAATVVSFILALLIVSFTGAHTVYILRNRTTIESLQDVRTTLIRVQYTRPDPLSMSSSLTPHLSGPGFSVVKVEPGEYLWDRGSSLANWKSIMGPSWWLWFRKCQVMQLWHDKPPAPYAFYADGGDAHYAI